MTLKCTLPAESPTAGQVAKRDLIEGLIKGLDVLACFDAQTPDLTPSELGRKMNISRAAARRFLLTLQHTGYVESDGRSSYRITPKVLALSKAYTGSAGLPKTVTPVLQRLTQELQFSSNCAVLEGSEAVYVARINAQRLLSTGIEPGTRLPAYTSTAGRILLASMEETRLRKWLETIKLIGFTPFTPTNATLLFEELQVIRNRGYDMTESLFEVGLRGVGVPLRNRQGEVIAALSVSMAVSTCTREQALASSLPLLQAAAYGLAALI
jgi:IclR family transcriptional regulator, pca regulon regulatory protein